MHKRIAGFTGISQSGYGIQICDGKHFSTPQGEFAEVKHGEEYSVKIINYNTHRCRFSLKIDGAEQGAWQISEQTERQLERPALVDKKFTFYRVKYAPDTSGIERGKEENGLVSATFTPEINSPVIGFNISEMGQDKTRQDKTYNDQPKFPAWCGSALREGSSGIAFKMFGKNTTKDLAHRIIGIMQGDFNIECPSDYLVLKWWKYGESKSYIDSFVSLDGNSDEFLCEVGFKESIVFVPPCSISFVKRIPTARITYRGEHLMYNLTADGCMSDLTKAIEEKWSLEKFYLLFSGERVFYDSTWVSEKTLYHFLRKSEIQRAKDLDIFNLSVVLSLPTESESSPGQRVVIPVALKVKAAEVTMIFVSPESKVAELKLEIQDEKGIHQDQQRLISAGEQLDDNKLVSDYSAILTEKTIDVVLRLPGGAMGAATGPMEIKSAGMITEPGSGGTKRKSPDSDWRAGATTLGKKSKQEFVSAPALDVDHRKAVTLTVRLVARDDELSDEEYEKKKSRECTPLSTAVPPHSSRVTRAQISPFASHP